MLLIQIQINNPRVDSIRHAFMTKWKIPDGTFSMMFNKTLLYSKGYGQADSANMQPVTLTRLFRVASVSKPITAVVVMQLNEEDVTYKIKSRLENCEFHFLVIVIVSIIFFHF